jgi:hypothetical protein
MPTSLSLYSLSRCVWRGRGRQSQSRDPDRWRRAWRMSRPLRYCPAALGLPTLCERQALYWCYLFWPLGAFPAGFKFVDVVSNEIMFGKLKGSKVNDVVVVVVQFLCGPAVS